MLSRRSLTAGAVLLTLALGATACGDDSTDESSAATTGAATTAAPTTVAATTTAATAAPTTAASSAAAVTTTANRFPAGSPEAAVADAYRTVFDSTLGYDAKAKYLEASSSLQTTIAAYTTAAARFGGFKLDPTAVSVTGSSAAVTYDVYFGTTPQYKDQKGAATLTSGVWQVSKTEFCSFMTAARIPCPA